MRSLGNGRQRSFGPEEERRVVSVCPDCRCEGHTRYRRAWLCERCYPSGGRRDYTGGDRMWLGKWWCPDAGDDHPDKYCLDCLPRNWIEGRCEGCDRKVMFHPHGNQRRSRPWLADPGWSPEGWHHTTFCSTRCRSLVNRMEAADRRAEDPSLCEVCDEVIEGRRSDALHCSDACKQKAYRERKAGS
jgi:hypothetical protein